MNSFASRFLLGGLVVFLGVVLLLDQLGLNFGMGKLWPLFMVFIGIYLVIKNTRNVMPGLFVLLIGILFQLDALRIFNFSVWNLWPLFIIFAGISVLIGRKDKFSSTDIEHGFITSNATFWGEEKVIKGEFKGATVNAVFGGVKLDLRNAEIQENVKIEINLVFGGVELLLPENVKLINNVTGVFGGLSSKAGLTSGDGLKTIEINGNAVFGGVDVK